MIVHVVAARPNFMKIAPVMRAIGEARFADQKLVHTGQHYDVSMSDVFFTDLGMPLPDIHLGVGSGSHAEQTARVMVSFEKVCLEERPDLVVVAGDVNSTLACALDCAKLRIPCAHVEAGLRSLDMDMPEEVNRIVTDRLCEILLTPSPDGDANLLREGTDPSRIFRVGNVMIDTLLAHLPRARATGSPARLGVEPGSYAVVTLHRPSNVDDPEVLGGLLDALCALQRELPVVFPVHPRTRKRLQESGLGPKSEALRLCEPLGYLDFLGLTSQARLVLTDSGGLQEETTALGIPCLTLRESTERPITIDEGTNVLCGVDPGRILEAARSALGGAGKAGRIPALWDGKASERIAEVLRLWKRPERKAPAAHGRPSGAAASPRRGLAQAGDASPPGARKVLHLADYGGPYPGNFVASLRALAPELAQRGMAQVLAFSHVAEGRPWLKELRADGFDVRLLPEGSRAARKQVAQIARTENISVIHTHFTGFDVSAWAVQQRGWLQGRPVALVWHVHSPTDFEPGTLRTFKDRLKWRLMGRTTHTVVVSDGGYRIMLERGVRTDRSRAIHNGIDASRLVTPEGERASARRTLGIAATEQLCLLFGWDPRRKGVDVAAAAVRALAEEEGLPVKLVVVGDGPARAFAERLFPAGLPPWMQVAPPLDSVGTYLAASDLFLSASRAEGFSYAVTEALAFGRPVATTDIPGMEWARAMPAAAFCRPDDADDLGRAIRHILSWSGEECATRIAAGREIIRDRYSVAAWARQVVGYYGEILGLAPAWSMA